MSNFSGSSRAINFAPEAITNQFGKQPAMVKMSMCQENRIQGMSGEGERLPVPAFEFPFLIKPAVYQKPDTVSLQQTLGAGYITGGTQESELYLQFSPPAYSVFLMIPLYLLPLNTRTLLIQSKKS
ncbi:hypothetical protein ES703_86298 [subsurface metagenome]